MALVPTRFGVCLVLAAVGCASGDPSVTAQWQQTLVEGEAAPSVDAVCALGIQAATGERGLCSATVISPHRLLTAAHCISPGNVGKDAVFSVDCAPRISLDGGAGGGALSVAWVLPHPDFDPWLVRGGSDVGLVATHAPLPAAPVTVRESSLPADGGRWEVVLVGYGQTDAGTAESAGERRQVSVAARSVDPRFLELADGAPTACRGDSGGPVLVEGQLAGVISHGQPGCTGVRATALAPYLDFLRQGDEAEDIPERTPPSSGCGLAPAAPLPVWVAMLGAWRRARRRAQRPEMD